MWRVVVVVVLGGEGGGLVGCSDTGHGNVQICTPKVRMSMSYGFKGIVDWYALDIVQDSKRGKSIP